MNDGSKTLLISKGATLEMLSVCSSYQEENQQLPLTDDIRNKIRAQYEESARKEDAYSL